MLVFLKKLCHVDIFDSNLLSLDFCSAGSFSSDSPVIAAHEQSVYTVETGKIHVRTFQVLLNELFVRLLAV